MNLQFRQINDFSEFLRLRQPWNELAGQCAVDHAYMRHEWFSCWIKHLGDKNRMEIMTAWNDGLLVAVTPLQRQREKISGIPVRSLRFMISGISPRCNFLVHPSLNPENIFDHLFNIKGWDILELQGMEHDRNSTQDFVSFLKNRCPGKYVVEEGRQSPYLFVEGNWNDYLQTLSQKHRKNINQGLNRLSRLEGCGFEKVIEYRRFHEVFDDILRISDRSWKGAGGTSISAVKNMAEFYREFCETTDSQDLWEMRLMKAGGQNIAFNFFLKHGPRLSGIRTDYDETYKYYGPGQMMILNTLKDLFDSAQKWEFDMGGMAADFKLDWTEKVRLHLNVSVTYPGVYGNLLTFGRNRILPILKNFKKVPPAPSAGAPSTVG